MVGWWIGDALYNVTTGESKEERTVFTFGKFTLPADKALVVKLDKKGDGRHHSFTVESEDVVRFRAVNKLGFIKWHTYIIDKKIYGFY